MLKPYVWMWHAPTHQYMEIQWSHASFLTHTRCTSIYYIKAQNSIATSIQSLFINMLLPMQWSIVERKESRYRLTHRWRNWSTHPGIDKMLCGDSIIGIRRCGRSHWCGRWWSSPWRIAIVNIQRTARPSICRQTQSCSQHSTSSVESELKWFSCAMSM